MIFVKMVILYHQSVMYKQAAHEKHDSYAVFQRQVFPETFRFFTHNFEYS